MNKFFIICGLLALIIIGAFVIRFFTGGKEDIWICQNGVWEKHGNPTEPAPLVGCGEAQSRLGGDRDEHGCIGSAGYSWCEELKECIRPWETKCEASPSSSVPLPRAQDTIRSFFALINDKRIPEAVIMMVPSAIPDESAKQAWGVNFNALNSVQITKITPSNQNEWTNQQEVYQVNLETTVNPASKNAPIPYYGWNNGVDTKWVRLEKVGKIWKIKDIATGP